MVRIQPLLGEWCRDIYKSYVIYIYMKFIYVYNLNVIDKDCYHQKLENKVTQVHSAVVVFSSFLISSAYI